jgi:hypothetical protein
MHLLFAAALICTLWSSLQDAFKLADAEYGRHQLLRASGGAPVILAVGTGLMVPGYTLIVDEGGAPDLYARLINKVRARCCRVVLWFLGVVGCLLYGNLQPGWRPVIHSTANTRHTSRWP